MSKKTTKEQDEIKVIKLASSVRSERDRIHSQSMIRQITLEGVRVVLCKKQSTGNDLYE